MELSQIYDHDKRGTLVVGAPRSGSHHISSLISLELKKHNINISLTKPEEFFYNLADVPKIIVNDAEYIDSVLPRQDNYIIGSIVLVYARIFLAKLIQPDFHIVRVVRKDAMAHLMSTIIHKSITLANPMASQYVSKEQFDNLYVAPYTVTDDDIYFFVRSIMLDKLVADSVVVYEDYASNKSEEIRSQVTLTPRQFFKNYDEVALKLANAGMM